jgi:hypothetical protein
MFLDKLYISPEKGTAGIVCCRGPKLVGFRPMDGWQQGTAFAERGQGAEDEKDAGRT